MTRRLTARKKLGASDGFTLMEMVVSIALIGLLMVALTQFFLGSTQIYRTQNAELDINMTGRTALDDVDNYVRQAVQVQSTYLTYATDEETLILSIPSISSSSQILAGHFDTVVYYLVGTSLYREVVPDSLSSRLAGTRLVGSYISLLTFTYDNLDLAQVKTVGTSLFLSKEAGRQVQSMTVTSKARLRN
jgi:prepilin-type N-terminal cleavage/methylation domain-containing protein